MKRKLFRPRPNRIYIVPTLFGVLSTLALFLMLLMAYTYQSNLAYAMTFFLTAFGFSAMTATHRFLQAVDIETYSSRPVFAGDIFGAPVLKPAVEGPDSALEFSPRGKVVVKKENGWMASRRGLHRLAQIEVKTTFPTGFFRAWRYAPVSLTIVAAPIPRDFGLRPGGEEAEDGSKENGTPEPEDLRELSPARPEDPSSRIDWRSFARGRGRLRKDFESNARPETHFRWADTESLNDPEDRLAQMAWWLRSLPAGARFSFEGPDGRRTGRLEDALENLARFEARE